MLRLGIFRVVGIVGIVRIVRIVGVVEVVGVRKVVSQVGRSCRFGLAEGSKSKTTNIGMAWCN